MDFWDAVRVLLRRWYVVLPTLAVSAAVSVAIVNSVAPTYRASGNMILVAPPQDVTIPKNPLAGSDLIAIVPPVMADPSIRRTITAAGGSANYAVGIPTVDSPLIVISVIAKSPAAALKSFDLIAKTVQEQLIRQQKNAGAVDAALFHAIVVTKPAAADRLSSSKYRAAAALGALGLVVTVSVGFLVEAAASHRRRGRLSLAERLEPDAPATAPTGRSPNRPVSF